MIQIDLAILSTLFNKAQSVEKVVRRQSDTGLKSFLQYKWPGAYD